MIPLHQLDDFQTTKDIQPRLNKSPHTLGNYKRGYCRKRTKRSEQKTTTIDLGVKRGGGVVVNIFYSPHCTLDFVDQTQQMLAIKTQKQSNQNQ